MPTVQIHPDVQSTLSSGRATVALETAVTTAGLPRMPMDAPPLAGIDEQITAALQHWRRDSPVNLETALAMQRIVRSADAQPATIAVARGQLLIGTDDEELVLIANDESAGKTSATDLAGTIASGRTAGTTVSATLAACALTHGPFDPGLRVFATGGIGGVHRHWVDRPDISSDLAALAETPVAVVCSGAKSLLDLPATVEALETLGVPVVGYRTDRFPRFFEPPDRDLPLRHAFGDLEPIAQLCTTHWNELDRPSAVLVVTPAPEAHTLDETESRRAVRAAEREADEQDIAGPARTPFVLDAINRMTDGRSLTANLALLMNNATVAARLARLMTSGVV